MSREVKEENAKCKLCKWGQGAEGRRESRTRVVCATYVRLRVPYLVLLYPATQSYAATERTESQASATTREFNMQVQ